MGIDRHSHSLRRHPALAPLRRVWAYLRNDWVREGVRMRWRRPKNLFQPYCYTSMNRYPRCFAFARDTLGEASALNLLSFGCASGEEAFTLAHYFPQARIKGIDINARAIAAARRATPPADADRIRFDVASSAEAEPDGSYDAVFAFAVFRDDALQELSAALRPSAPLRRFRPGDVRFGALPQTGGAVLPPPRAFPLCRQQGGQGFRCRADAAGRCVGRAANRYTAPTTG